MPPTPPKRGNESGTAKMDFELNGPPQPQMVGFCGLALHQFQKKPAVNYFFNESIS